MVNYVVQPGDTLTKIAQRFRTTVSAIVAANPRIKNPDVIFEGEVIVIPITGQIPSTPFPSGGMNIGQPGTPGEKPLHFVSITLNDGTNVQGSNQIPLNPSFVLTFDKNVVNNAVWQNNKESFTLTNDNQNIPINVTKVSDKVDFSKRQNIYIQPISPLSPNTSYTLKISPGLQGLNGETLGETTGGKGISITFKTTASRTPLD